MSRYRIFAKGSKLFEVVYSFCKTNCLEFFGEAKIFNFSAFASFRRLFRDVR